MATRKQIAANRRNARKSTGPRTAEGKARSAENAVTHGLTARAAILPDEDAAEFEAFVAGVRADLAPQGMLEEALAVRVAQGMWRLLRVPRIEAACFAYELAKVSERTARLREIPGLPPSAAHGEEHALGAAFLRLDADGLPNSLARYEAAIQRGVERSLKLLTDTQKQRRETANAALRSGPNNPVDQAGQGFPAEERDRSRRAGQAGNQPPRHGGGSGANVRPTECAGSAPATAATAASAVEPERPEEPSHDYAYGYAPAQPGERIEHRVHGNTRYIVRVPVED